MTWLKSIHCLFQESTPWMCNSRRMTVTIASWISSGPPMVSLASHQFYCITWHVVLLKLVILRHCPFKIKVHIKSQNLSHNISLTAKKTTNFDIWHPPVVVQSALRLQCPVQVKSNVKISNHYFWYNETYFRNTTTVDASYFISFIHNSAV